MTDCFLYDLEGFYAGTSVAFRRLPANATLKLLPERPWKGLWPRFVDGDWILEEDHRERTKELFGEDAQEGTDFWLPEDDWQASPRKMTKPGPLPEGALLTPPDAPQPSLAEVRADACGRVDEAASKAILAGFDYGIDGASLHFSYDSFDQQNFSDSAHVASRAISGEEGLPQTVNWNAYQADGALVRLELGPADFLALYTKGALSHKAARMEEGGARKAAIMQAQDAAAVQALLDGWGI